MHPYKLIRAAMSELLRAAISGNAEAGRRLKSFASWAITGEVDAYLLGWRPKEGEGRKLYSKVGLLPDVAEFTPLMRDRAFRFMTAFEQIEKAGSLGNPVESFVPLWNARLFFEILELFESRWIGSQEDVDAEDVEIVLEGIIVSATGMHHFETGNVFGAMSMLRGAEHTLGLAKAEIGFDTVQLQKVIATLAEDIERGRLNNFRDMKTQHLLT
jgi:hypothetical protein